MRENVVSLVGGALTRAAALVLIGFWVVSALGHGGSGDPYLGIIVDLCLPGVFLLGLLLIPVGMYFRQARLKKSGEIRSIFPQVYLKDPLFGRGLDFVVVATAINFNFIIVGTATRAGICWSQHIPAFVAYTFTYCTFTWINSVC